MFVDEVDIRVEAGAGGNGCLSFRREKRVPRGGPNGGDGGAGGSIYLTASAHHNTLISFRFHPEFKADRGEHGLGSNCAGRDAADLLLDVPPGTVVSSLTTTAWCRSRIWRTSATGCSSRAADEADEATRRLRRRPTARHAAPSQAHPGSSAGFG